MNAINNGSIYSQNPNTGSRVISGIGTAGLFR